MTNPSPTLAPANTITVGIRGGLSLWGGGIAHCRSWNRRCVTRRAATEFLVMWLLPRYRGQIDARGEVEDVELLVRFGRRSPQAVGRFEIVEKARGAGLVLLRKD